LFNKASPVSQGLVTETTAALTSSSEKKLIENSEHCVEFRYTTGKYYKTEELANK
jgi:hypothetical protein